MTLIDGKAISEQVKQEIAAEVAEIVARGGKRPHLAAILVGHDGGSETYVAAKVKACEVCGFKSSLIRYESDVTEEELLAKVRELNEDDDVDGFIVQLPLPKHISEQKVIETIDYRKIPEEMYFLDKEIKTLMDEYEELPLSKYVERVIQIHHRMTVIHAFRDGNGRTTRAFANMLLLKRNVSPVFFRDKEKDEYKEALKVADLSGQYDICLLYTSPSPRD